MDANKKDYLQHYLAPSLAETTEANPKEDAAAEPSNRPIGFEIVSYAYPKVYDAVAEGKIIVSRQAIDDNALRHASDAGLKRWDIAEWQRQRQAEREQWDSRFREQEDRVEELREQLASLTGCTSEVLVPSCDERRPQNVLNAWNALSSGLEQRITEQFLSLQERLAQDIHTQERELIEVRLAQALEQTGKLRTQLEFLEGIETELQQSRKREKRMTTEKEAIAGQCDRFETALQDSLDKLEIADNRSREAEARLADRENGIHALEHELRGRTDHIRALENTIGELKNSHSWRVTKPMRTISTGLRSTASALRTLPEYRRRTRQVLAERGARGTLGRAYGKLTGKPLLSVIITVDTDTHRGLDATLAALARYPSGFRHEVILVADGVELSAEQLPADLRRLKIIKHHKQRGTRRARTHAASKARADCLIFLEAGCAPRQTCLEQLVRTLWTHERAAAVGPKLLLPDGRLWGAGGVLWEDGQAIVYGHGDDPAKPEYNFVREVHFIPAGCIAMRRKAWKSVSKGSQDYGDTPSNAIDLSLRLQSMGAEVWYQPAALASMETSEDRPTQLAGSSPPAEQLVEQWGAMLRDRAAHKGVAPELARDRGVTKRVLVVDYVMLTPDQDSGSLRMANLLHLFQQLGYQVTFVASNLEYLPPYGPRLQQQGIEVLYAPTVYSIPEYLRNNGHRFDVVLLSRADIANANLEAARTYAPSATIIFDTVDLHFLREQRMAELEGCSDRARDADARMRQEIELVDKADVTLVVSPVEKRIIEQYHETARVAILSNIHEIYGSAQKFSEREGLLFIGGFRHPPNIDAVVYFVREVLPLIRREIPDIRLTIVGSNPTEEVIGLASEHIEVTGYVPDVSGLFARSRLSVAPLRYGAGVKGKVNMSMAYGVPVVATPMAVEGMYLNDGVDVLVAEDAPTFAEAVVTLYRDRALWRNLSTHGLKNLERHFSKQAALRALRRILAEQGRNP